MDSRTPTHVDTRTPIFYYDLASPECYLAAERVSFVLPVAPVWEPVIGSWGEGGEQDVRGGRAGLRLGPEPDRGAIEQLVLERGLQAMRWPVRWPPDSHLAMRAAAYAKLIGRATAFSLAAFRQAFAAGRDLDDLNTVVIAAAACEMHPAAVIKAVGLAYVARALEEATERAVASGVRRLPALCAGGVVFEGETRLDRATAALVARA
ncbi:MAG: DsbA family protein [Solirubrobacteraceae bacterium]